MENPSLLDFAQQAAGKKNDKRLQYLKLTADLTQNFLATAIQSCCVIMDDKLRTTVKELLENCCKEVSADGTIGKLISNFFLHKVDNEISNRLKNIFQLHKEIKSDQTYDKFDKDRACDILVVLARQFERWDSKYQENSDAPNYALQLRPQVEQAIRQQNKEVKTKIDALLANVKALIIKHYEARNFSKANPEDYQPSCFISYAWPLLEGKPHEAWTQTFIQQFALDLHQAGVNAKIDLLHSRYGHDSVAYMSRGIKESDYIILFGTESLYAKHVDDKKFGSAVRNELNLIKSQIAYNRNNNRGDRVFVMLLTGTIETSLPQDFKGYTVIESFQDKRGYLAILEEILLRMYKLADGDDLNKEFEKFWQDTKNDSLLTPLYKGLEESAVEKYYTHKQKRTQEDREKHKQDSLSLVDDLIGLSDDSEKSKSKEQSSSSASSPKEPKNTPPFKTISECEEYYKINERPSFSKVEVEILRGDDLPECSAYFRKDNPLFIGRENELKALYKEIVSTSSTSIGCHVIVGSPGIGKTTLALAYVHSYGADRNLYPGGVFWFELNKGEATAEDISRRFAKHITGKEKTEEKEDILLSDLQETIKNLHKEGKRTLFIFNETENYDKIQKYIKLLQGTHHHLIITSIYRNWGSFKEHPLKLEEFTLDESLQFVKRHLNKAHEREQAELLATKCKNFPQLLRKIICYINTSFNGLLNDYFNAAPAEPVEMTPKILRRTKSLEHDQYPDIHRKELTESLINIFAKQHPCVFEQLAVSVFYNHNRIAEELFPIDKKLDIDPIRILYDISLLEKVDKGYKIPYGIRNAVRAILECNEAYLIKNSKIKFIRIEEAFLKALQAIETKIPSIYDQNYSADYRNYDPYISHALTLAGRIERYKEFSKIKNASPRVANLLLYSAYAYFRLGLFSEAEGMAKTGLDLAERGYGKNTKDMIVHYRVYGRILSKENKLDIAEPILRQAIEVNLKTCSAAELPQYEVEQAIAHGYLGALLTAKGLDFYDDAAKELQTAERMLYKTYQNSKITTYKQYYIALTKRHWGEHFSIKGEYDAAIKSYESALEVITKYFEVAIKPKQSNVIDYEQYLFVTAIRRRMGTAYYLLGKYSKAKEKLNSTVTILNEFHGSENHEEIISCLNILAKISFWQGSYQEARKKFDSIINSTFAKVRPLTQPIIDAIYYQGRLLIVAGHYLKGCYKLVEALKKQQEFFTNSNIDREQKMKSAELNINLTNVLESLDFNDYQRVLQNETAKIIHQIGFAYYKRRQYDIAQIFYEEALNINDIIRSKHPKALLSELGLASIAFKRGNYRKAEKSLSDILIMQEKNKNTQSLEIANTHRFLAELYIKKAQFDKAKKHIEEANKTWNELLKDNEGCILPEMVSTKIVQGFLAWYAIHDYDTVVRLFKEVLEEQKRFYDEQPHPNVAQIKAYMGRIKYFQGDYLGAVQLYFEAKQMFEKCYNEDVRKLHPLLAYLNYYIAEIHYQYWLYIEPSNDSKHKKIATNLLKDALIIFGEDHPENVPILCALSRIAIGSKASGIAWKHLSEAKTILKKTFDKEVIHNHPQYAMVLGTFSKISDDFTSSRKYCNKSITMLLKIYKHPVIHPRIIEFFSNSLFLNKGKSTEDDRKKMIAYFYQRYYKKTITVERAKDLFFKDFTNCNLSEISDIRLLMDLQRIISCFADLPISSLNNQIVLCISNKLKLVLESPLFSTYPQQYIYILSSSHTKPSEEHLSAAKNLGKLLAEKGFNLINDNSQTNLMQATISVISENNGKTILTTAKNPTDWKTDIMTLATGIVVLPGGLDVLHKTIEILINSSNKTIPISVFNINHFYDGFNNILEKALACSYIDADLFNRIRIFSESESEQLLNHLSTYQAPLKIPKDRNLKSETQSSVSQSPLKLQAKLANSKDLFYFSEETADRNSNFGFTKLEISRTDAITQLLKLKNNTDDRKFLSEEIFDVLLAGKIFSDNNLKLLDDYKLKHADLEKLFTELKENFPVCDAQNIDDFVLWLKRQGRRYQKDHDNLRDKRSSLYDAKQSLLNFCQQPPIFEWYVNEFNNQLELGYKSALLLARLNNINLYVWRKDTNSPKQLIFVESHQSTLPLKPIHIICDNNSTSFNLLSIISTNQPANQEALEIKAEIVSNPEEQKFSRSTRELLSELKVEDDNPHPLKPLQHDSAQVPVIEERQTDSRNPLVIDSVQQIDYEVKNSSITYNQ